MARRVFIDAMNVIRSNPSLAKLEDKASLGAARRELLRLCRAFAAREEHADYVVVFDGSGREAGADRSAEPLLVLDAGEQSADEVIRQKAADARAMGLETWVVSNDAEVRAAGTHALWSEEFYEDLTRRPAPREPARPEELARRLVERLIAADRLPRSAAADTALAGELVAHLEYYDMGALAIQKLAKKLEPIFRRHSRANPDPDPQKVFYRTLREILTAVMQEK